MRCTTTKPATRALGPSEVRTRLAAGGSRIRTIGPGRERVIPFWRRRSRDAAKKWRLDDLATLSASRIEFPTDSSLEEAGFEPSVPLRKRGKDRVVARRSVHQLLRGPTPDTNVTFRRRPLVALLHDQEA
jgi:hypothetical protein